MPRNESLNTSAEQLTHPPRLIPISDMDALDRQLRPEVARKAQEAAGVLLGKFHEQGLASDDVGLVTVGNKAIVMDTAYAGLFYRGKDGDWKDSKDFAVEFNGQMCDTRTGMTDEVYRAFIAGAQRSGAVPLPDSQTEGERGPIHPGTWLTGGDYAHTLGGVSGIGIVGNAYDSFGYVKDGEARIGSAADYSSLQLRQILFRPSLVIGGIATLQA